MNSVNQTNHISSFTARLLRERFGKGPESVQVSLSHNCISLHFRNFMNPVEQHLINEKEEKVFRRTRELLMKSLLPELTVFMERELGVVIRELYYDWGIHHTNGMIVALLDEFHLESKYSEDYPGRNEIHAKVIDVSERVQKAPERMDSWWVNPKTLIIYRQGILLLLEKEMISMGYDLELKTAKRKLEKQFLVEAAADPLVSGKEMSDVFVDWDFERDQSIIAYTFVS
ncbi:Na-translocating system protein MpsC family protein [Paenibacillus sp. JX-17]|uniref:Na-translocating system protein MpsC family protein n=1 Tax=Paenibacillus lacisoli TaxID=3064525 RepID=A0ABT9C8V4_9BACL|nr:Na-translocating system protein MpsC family protein [Paenibacillus sp. JX-17]MDO7905677.1 Na-translocating system protein MpsC family protein [Paenibacillus sp. JX-17]